MTAPYVLRETGGSITVSGAAQAEIVRHAVERVRGARLHRPRRGLEIDLSDGRAHIELELAVRMGAVLPEVAREVQDSVAAALGEMCAVAVDSIDVSIEEVGE